MNYPSYPLFLIVPVDTGIVLQEVYKQRVKPAIVYSTTVKYINKRTSAPIKAQSDKVVKSTT